MLEQDNKQVLYGLARSLKIIGVITGLWAILFVFVASLTYSFTHPDFSLFTTYLSDIGDAGGWPQIVFNSGTLISAPLRYIILVLVVLQLSQLGAGRTFVKSVLVVGFFSSLGTVFMTAIPYSMAPSIHISGIALYFIGTVVLQILIFTKEWSLREIPKELPLISLSVVVVFIIFASLLALSRQGFIGRSTPAIFEWMCFLSSIIWLFAHSIILGNTDLVMKRMSNYNLNNL